MTAKSQPTCVRCGGPFRRHEDATAIWWECNLCWFTELYCLKGDGLDGEDETPLF